MIEFSCSKCQAPMRVDEAMAGKAARCPRCAEGLTIPAPEAGEVLTVEAAGIVEVETPVAGRRSCKSCGEKLEGEAVICIRCGLNQQTGERLGGGARVLLTAEERLAQRTAGDQKSLSAMIVGALLHPWSTLETIDYQLSFYETMFRMTLFWLTTLVIVGVMGAAARHTADLRTSQGPGGVIPAGEPRHFKGTLDGFDGEFVVQPGVCGRGQRYQLSRRFKGAGPSGFMWHQMTPVGASPDDRRWVKYVTGTQRGGSVVPLAPERGDKATLHIRYENKIKTRQINLTYEVELGTPGLPPLSLATAAKGALVNIALSITMLALWGLALGLGGKLFTGDGRWLELFAALAFLQGVTNLGMLVLLPFPGAVGQAWLLVWYCFVMWTAVLYSIAVMHLYSLDIRSALLLVFMAFGLFYVVAYLIQQATEVGVITLG